MQIAVIKQVCKLHIYCFLLATLSYHLQTKVVKRSENLKAMSGRVKRG